MNPQGQFFRDKPCEMCETAAHDLMAPPRITRIDFHHPVAIVMSTHRRSILTSLSSALTTLMLAALMTVPVPDAAAEPARPVIKPAAGGGWEVTTPAYTARVSAQGSLESLQSGGYEWLAAPKSPTHGLLLAIDATNRSPASAKPADGGILAQGEGFTVLYLFHSTAVEIIQGNRGLPSPGSLGLALNPALATARDADTGAAFDIPALKHLSGHLRLLAPGGASLTTTDASCAMKDSHWLLSFPGAPRDGESRRLLELNPSLDIADRVVIRPVLPTADHTFWSRAPVMFTAEVAHAAGGPMNGECAFVLRSFLTREVVREQVRPLALSPGSTHLYEWPVENLAPGMYVAEWEVRQESNRGVAARARFAFDAAAILPPPPPDDFDAFWADTLTEQAAIPEDLQIKLHDSPGESEVYKFSFAGLLGHRCHGWLTVPKDKGKKVPGVLILPPSGLRRFNPASFPKGDRVGMVISINTLDVDLPDSDYDWATWPAPYLVHGILSKHRYWLRYSFAALVRAAEIMARRPEVQADNILVTGSSQGGGLTLVAAGLYPKFKAAVAGVPAFCRPDWNLLHLNPPYFPIAANLNDRPMILRTLSYYDPAQFARRIRCPTWITLGLMDDVTPSMGVFCAYNVIPGTTKSLTVVPWGGHGSSRSYEEAAKGTWP